MIKNETHPFQYSFIDLAGQVAEMFSFSRSIGQLFGYLYMCTEPQSLEEIASACRMSKGNASIHLRTLEGWNAVHRSWKAGIRKDYYSVNNDLKGVIIQRLQEGVSRRLEHTRQKFDGIKHSSAFAEYAKQPNGTHWIKRLEEIESLLQQAETAFRLLPKFLEFRTIFQKGSKLSHEG